MQPADRERIAAILAAHDDMTIATNRPDGWPQATTVSFVSEGTTIWFGCGGRSQKAENLRRDDRASVTIDRPTADWDEIVGLSMAVRAREVDDPAEREKVGRLMFAKFPQIARYADAAPGTELAVFRLEPVLASVLDYRKGFGHTDEVAF